MKQKSRNGFTLIELIVAIAIMGVLLIITLPIVANIKNSNKEKPYDAYKNSLIAASKLYIDSYGKDKFGGNNSGCIKIKYSDLKDKRLIKDFNNKKISCSSDETFIEVRKVLDEYSYKINIVCKNTKDNKEVYKLIQITSPDNICSLEPDLRAPTIEISPKNTANKWYNAKDLAVKIKVFDESGLNSNISVSYNWYNKTTGVTTTTGTHNYKNKKGKEILSYTIPMATRPTDAGGKYKLTVTPDDSIGNGLQDALGNKTLVPVIAEEYWIDNENPKFNNTEVTSTNENYASKDIIIHMDATDNFTQTNDLKLYISNTGYQKDGSWQNYNNTVNWKVAGEYDGKTRSLYISIKDLAGNIEQKVFNYTIYKECSATIDDGTWYDDGTCSKSCGGGLKPQLKNQNDRYLKTTCPAISQKVVCNTMDCCSKVTSSYGNWGSCQGSCGTGTKYRTITYKGIDGRTCSTKSDSASCDTGKSCIPKNSCQIRGNTVYRAPYPWVCTSNHNHTTGYIHYCTDSNGGIIFHGYNSKDVSPLSGRVDASINGFNWVCPDAPYTTGWTIING